jgi:hypothetical protein
MAQIWTELRRLSRGAHPLMQLAGSMPDARVALTPDGAEVLAGRRDFVDLNGIDLWLGGVQLEGSTTPWRWDGNRLVS